MAGRKKLIVGIAAAVLAVILMLVYISDVRAQSMASREQAIARYGGETVEVCVAVRDISAGELITTSDVEMLEWVVDLLPAGALTDSKDVVGLVANSTILANEPISSQKIGVYSEGTTVPEGLNAVTIPSQDTLAVGGAIEGGSLVDVYAADGDSVRLLGQNILVLETSNSDISQDSSSTSFGSASSRASISWVTLAVTPESVQELISASRQGSLYLVLPGTQASDVSSSAESSSTDSSSTDSSSPDSSSTESSSADSSSAESNQKGSD